MNNESGKAKYKVQRVDSLIKEEISKIILKEMEFPGTLVTVTEVDTKKNMHFAKIKISVLPSSKGAWVLKSISKSSRYLQSIFENKVKLRPMPKFVFEIDYGPEKAAEVEKIVIKGKIEE